MTQEQRLEVISRLQRGEELPSEWRNTLFPLEKQESELMYGGKQREEDILLHTMAVPLQSLRTFSNGGGSRERRSLQLRLKDTRPAPDEDAKGVRLCPVTPPPGLAHPSALRWARTNRRSGPNQLAKSRCAPLLPSWRLHLGKARVQISRPLLGAPDQALV